MFNKPLIGTVLRNHPFSNGLFLRFFSLFFMKGSCFMSGKIWSFSISYSLDYPLKFTACVCVCVVFFGVSVETIILFMKLLPLSLLLEENKKELRKYINNLIRKTGILCTERSYQPEMILVSFLLHNLLPRSYDLQMSKIFTTKPRLS